MGDSNSEAELQLVPKYGKMGWDIMPGGCTADLIIRLHPVKPWMIFTPDCKSLHVWNHETGTRVASWVIPDVDDALVADFIAHDAQKDWIVVTRHMSFAVYERHGSDLRCIKVLTTETGDKRAYTLATHRTLPCLLAGFCQQNFFMWHWEHGWEKVVLKGHFNWVFRLAFHPMEPQIFASAGGDDTIKVWNLGKRSVIQSLKDTGKGYINQIGFYNGLEKSLLISSHSEKGSVKVWDYKKGVCLAKWEACKQAIKSVLFHPRLPYIFTAAKDGEIRVWNDSNYQEVASYFRAWDGDFNGMGACKTSDMLILAGNAEFRVVQVVKKREEKVLEQKEKEVQPNHRQSLTKDRENPVLATPSLESDYRIRQEGPRVEPGCKKVVDEMSADHRAVERMLTQKIEKMEVDMQAAVVRLETKLAEAMSMHKSLEGCKSRISQLESERDKLTERVNELEHKFKKEITTKRERTALLREFSGKELLDATNNFEVNLRSRDGNWHEHVYSGKLRDGTLIAVKRMRDHASAQIIHDRNEMKTEVVDRLRLLQHPHLLTLLGVCYEESCLVYEHMERGSLKNWIVQGENHTGGSLPWYARFRVMAEVARGLDFLHSDLSASRGGPVIHCAIKPTNILLDQNFVAKIGGVDQALLVPTTPDAEGKTSVAPEFAAHNSQYIAPEYWQSRVFDEKTDVYAFGITLLEMLTGYFSNAFKVIEDSIEDLPAFERALDANAGIWDVDLARKVANLGLRCASPNARERPGMTTPGVGILPVLEGVARKVDLAQSISDHQR